MESALFGHYRLSQEPDEQTKVFAVVCKKKDEVGTNKVPGVYELLRPVVAVEIIGLSVVMLCET